MNLFVQRRLQILKYGWRDAGRIASGGAGISRLIRRLRVFVDILRHFKKYHLFSNQYFDNQLWMLPAEKKDEIATRLGAENLARDKRIMQWRKSYFSNWKFLNEYTQMKYETSPRLQQKRNEAYRKRFNMGKNCWVQYGVTIIAEHFSMNSHVSMGENVLLARGCDIDITGDISIGNDVGILEGAKILTHAHDSMGLCDPDQYIPDSNRAIRTPLAIHDGVSICAHAVILPGVREIGENSIVGAGVIVSRPVPANVSLLPDGRMIRMPKTIKRIKH